MRAPITVEPWGFGCVRKMMRGLREDVGRCVSLFSNICLGYNPSWVDVNLLLRELFCPDEKDKIIEKDAQLTLQPGGNGTAWPPVDPNWEYNQTDQDNCCMGG